MRSFIKSHKRGVSADADVRYEALSINTSDTITLVHQPPTTTTSSATQSPLLDSPDGVSPRRSRNPIKNFLKPKSSSGNLAAAASVTKQQSPKLKNKSSFSNLTGLSSHKHRAGRGTPPLLSSSTISNASPTIYGTKTHEWGSSSNRYPPVAPYRQPEAIKSKQSLPSIDENGSNETATRPNAGLGLISHVQRMPGVHSELDLGTFESLQRKDSGTVGGDFSIVYISKTMSDARDDSQSIESNASSEFSFEENRNSGRNSSIKYYKSRDQLEREQRIFDEERRQAEAAALAEEFEGLNVEDAIRNMEYDGEPFEDDDETDELFNRKLFSSDDEEDPEPIPQQQPEDFQNFSSDFEDEDTTPQSMLEDIGAYEADGECFSEEEVQSVSDIQEMPPSGTGDEILQLLGRISQLQDQGSIEEPIRTNTMDSNATLNAQNTFNKQRFSWFPNDDTMKASSTQNTGFLMKPVFFHDRYENPSSSDKSDGSLIDEINEVPEDFDFEDYSFLKKSRFRGARSNSLLNHPSKTYGVSAPIRSNSFETHDKTITLFNSAKPYSTITSKIAEVDVSSCDDEDFVASTPKASFADPRMEASPLTTISEASYDSSGFVSR